MSDDKIDIYSEGLFTMSVCAPRDMTIEEVEQRVNILNSPGTKNGWRKSKDPTFKEGSPNPCVCNNNLERLHWLLDC